MTLEQIPTESALLVVDLQHGTTSAPSAHPIDEIVARAARLTDAWRRTGRTVVLASVDGTPPGRTTYQDGAQSWPEPFATVRPELGSDPDDVRVVRRSWSALAGTGLHEQLAARRVQQVVVVGLATSFGVESTARAAYDLGYDVVVVSDAVTDRSREAHDHVLSRVVPALGQVATTDEILALVDRPPLLS